ncbi:MAG TPA: beta-ketoacyl synthase N-terminal-like domain-containing protein [Dehalococcoidia bacterium]|nr:beta-ketoacyl synthase N-terminal-like domain-containing protein [Dehalococcoidia bacterium]
MLNMRDVYVVGVGMIKFGRYPEQDIGSLGGQAALLALKDAGLSLKDIQILMSGNLYQTSMSGQRILKEVGMTGVPVYNVSNACASGSTAFREAVFAVGSGAYEVAMAVGTEQMGKMGLLGAPSDPSTSPEGVLGTGLMPGVFGMAGMEHMRKYGTTHEQFAKVSVKNHHHAMANPLSQYQVEVSLEDVLNSRMVAYPNTLYMCCPTGDGAAAAIVCSAEKARQLAGGGKLIKVVASALTTDPYTPRTLTFPDINTMTKACAQQAYEQAGMSPKDLDSVELHDCFATAEILHYENLMLCGPGEAGRMIDEGRTALGGDIPVNTSGGLLSKGHPIGATGVANVCEIVWQLRGQAGGRQVEGHKAGLAHTIGLGSACAIHILTT